MTFPESVFCPLSVKSHLSSPVRPFTMSQCPIGNEMNYIFIREDNEQHNGDYSRRKWQGCFIKQKFNGALFYINSVLAKKSLSNSYFVALMLNWW